jgi:hypothetical protein
MVNCAPIVYHYRWLHDTWELHVCTLPSIHKMFHFHLCDIRFEYLWWKFFNKMKMHCSSKRIAIPYQVNTVNLQGILSEYYEEAILQIYQWDKVQFQLIITMTVELHIIIKANISLTRSCTHSIPLIQGERLINRRADRYTSFFNDGIVTQEHVKHFKPILQLSILLPDHCQKMYDAYWMLFPATSSNASVVNTSVLQCTLSSKDVIPCNLP